MNYIRNDENFDINKIKVGNRIEIYVGYKESGINKEFVGYVKRIEEKNNSWQIDCEDGLFVFDETLEDKELKTVDLKTLLDDVCKQINDKKKTTYKVETNYKYTYEKFVFYQATGTKVLQAVQKDTSANIFFKDDTLFIRPPYPEYGEKSAVIKFDLTKNVQASNLTTKNTNDRNIEIVVKYQTKDKNGKIISKEIKTGTTGGESKTFIGFSNDEKENKELAKNLYQAQNYTGYEGDFTGWLVPRVEPEESVEITDPNNPSRKGVYYVTATEVNFSSNGGTRKISLGKKLSD